MKTTAYKWIRIISIPVAALLLTACQFEDLRYASTAERVKVQLNLGMQAPVNAVATRAAKASFYNLWAFQFDSSGKLVGTPQQLSTAQAQVEEGSNLSVNLAVGTQQTIYLLSAGKKLAPNFADIKTLADLKAYRMNYIVSDKGSYASTLVDAADIPYAGCVENANVVSLGQGAGMLEYNSPEGFSGSIGMKEMVAKVTLRYKYNVDTHTLQGVRLQNVNSHIGLGDPASYTPADGVEFKLLNLQQARTPDAQGYYTASWYVAKNMQGTNANITSETDRYYKPDRNLAPQYGLCLEVLGQSKADLTKYSVHRIFVGNNNTSNFDVEANHHYSLTTEFTTGYIEGANTDPRLEESQFTGAKVVFFSSNQVQKGLCTNAHGTTYDLDAHYDCRPISVEVSNARVELGIYTDANCTQLAHPTAPAHNWLKLSIEPNYTLAVNNNASPLSNSISTEVRVPSKLNFYLYNDEYVDVKQDNTSPNRSLYLKITTTELGVSNPQTTVDRMRIDQRPIKVYGQFGGWDDTKKEYTALLGMDRVEEYRVAYTEPGPTTSADIIGGNYMASSYPPLTDVSYGLEPTIILAENRENWSKMMDVPELPRKTGGVIDLYQYDYYNTFSTRFCYDRNRDLDGSGRLEENEIKWYVPSGNQWLGCYVDVDFERITSHYWYSNVWNKSQGAIYTHTGLMWGSNASMTNKNCRVKCVRNLPLTSESKSPEVVIESLPNTLNGGTTQYAVIDASRMPNAVDRGDDFYTEALLHEYNLDGNIGNAIMEDDGVTQKKVRRVQRHLIDQGPDQYISKKFAIAPKDIKNNGEYGWEDIGWATTAGWYQGANSDSDSSIAVEKGCPMYKGRDGNDAPGTWRLPTKKELTLMQIYKKRLYATTKETSFVDLSKSYYSATEYSKEHCAYIYSMQYLSNAYKNKTTTGTNGHAHYIYIRCIRDIPTTGTP